MENIKEFYLKYRLIIGTSIFLVLLACIFIIYRIHKNTYITAQFNNLRPFHHRINVYYKGFKIGHAEKVRPDKDYQHTIMTIVLNPTDLKLPVNTVAKLMREKKGRREVDYIDMIYPDTPSIYYLKSGDKIAGKATVDIQSFLSAQDPESLEAIRDNLAKSAENLNVTLSALADLFDTLRAVVEENRPNLLGATENMRLTTLNIRTMSEKLNGSVSQERLTNTFNNVDTSSDYVKTTIENTQNVTNELAKITKNIDSMLPTIDCILSETYSVMRNTNGITCNICKTMGKPFGGMRILFGKSGSNCNKCSKCH